MSACEVCGSIGTVAMLQDPVTMNVVGYECGVCGHRHLYPRPTKPKRKRHKPWRVN